MQVEVVNTIKKSQLLKTYESKRDIGLKPLILETQLPNRMKKKVNRNYY